MKLAPRILQGLLAWAMRLIFLNQFDKNNIAKYVKALGDYTREKLLAINDLSIIGAAKNKTGIVSFVLKNVHPHDVATFLGAANIAIRAGHHCTQPLMDFYGLPATSRASFSIYNNREEVDFLVEEVGNILDFFGG